MILSGAVTIIVTAILFHLRGLSPWKSVTMLLVSQKTLWGDARTQRRLHWRCSQSGSPPPLPAVDLGLTLGGGLASCLCLPALICKLGARILAPQGFVAFKTEPGRRLYQVWRY